MFLVAGWSPIRFLGLLLAAGLVARAAEPAIPATVTESVEQARDLITKDAAKVPGLAAAIAWNGKIVWSQGFGYADLKTKEPVNPATTRFRIANVSESLTAAALMRFVDRGLVDLDAPVQKYVPDFPVKKEGIVTTRLLAAHLSGIRDYQWLEALRNEPFPSVHASLAIFKDDPLVAPPGEEFHYSIYDYTLISAVMEAAAHQNFLYCIQDEVLAPLGMIHTRPDRAGAADRDRTQFYRPGVLGTFTIDRPIDCSYKWASGGFLSTADDLVVFGSALLQPGYLRPESLVRLFTPERPTGGKRSWSSIGWNVVTNRLGRAYCFQTGDEQGATSFLMVLPKEKIVIAILSNVSGAQLAGRADPQRMADCFLALAPWAKSQFPQKPAAGR